MRITKGRGGLGKERPQRVEKIQERSEKVKKITSE